MDELTRERLNEKAEQFQIEYDPSYWRAKQPPPTKKYLEACEVIASLTGLAIKLMETEPCE